MLGGVPWRRGFWSGARVRALGLTGAAEKPRGPVPSGAAGWTIPARPRALPPLLLRVRGILADLSLELGQFFADPCKLLPRCSVLPPLSARPAAIAAPGLRAWASAGLVPSLPLAGFGSLPGSGNTPARGLAPVAPCHCLAQPVQAPTAYSEDGPWGTRASARGAGEPKRERERARGRETGAPAEARLEPGGARVSSAPPPTEVGSVSP